MAIGSVIQRRKHVVEVKLILLGNRLQANRVKIILLPLAKLAMTITKMCPELKAAAVTGYGFVDMEILSVGFQQMVLKECGNSAGLVLEDNPRKRKGSASHLRVRCETCGWVYTFYASKKVQHSFDVNARLVYAMRSMGQGHVSMKRFCSFMNMPPNVR